MTQEVPLPSSDRGESRGKCSVPVRQEMTQDVAREVDREEEISQSGAEHVNESSTLQRDDDADLEAGEERSVVAMNTLNQNAGDVAEPERWRRRGARLCRGAGQRQEQLRRDQRYDLRRTVHDDRVIAVRDKFMNASDEEVSDEDGRLSRSMTIKTINTIMTERIWINCAASEIVFQPLYPDTSDPLHDESVIGVREELDLHLLLRVMSLMTAST